jgi:hypothetical protein
MERKWSAGIVACLIYPENYSINLVVGCGKRIRIP